MPVAVSIFDASGKLIEHNAIAEKYASLNDMNVHATGERKKIRRWWADTGIPIDAARPSAHQGYNERHDHHWRCDRCRTGRWEEDDDDGISSTDTRRA